MVKQDITAKKQFNEVNSKYTDSLENVYEKRRMPSNLSLDR